MCLLLLLYCFHGTRREEDEDAISIQNRIKERNKKKKKLERFNVLVCVVGILVSFLW